MKDSRDQVISFGANLNLYSQDIFTLSTLLYKCHQAVFMYLYICIYVFFPSSSDVGHQVASEVLLEVSKSFTLIYLFFNFKFQILS